MKGPIISVSGLRGVVGESLTPELAVRYAAAFASSAPPGAVVLSRDGRASGPMIADAVRSSLSAMGRQVLDAGVAATPTVGVLVKSLGAAGALQVSASHNPPQYNGLKLFGASGRVLAASEGEQVKARYLQGQFSWSPFDSLGHPQPIPDTTSEHLRRVLQLVDVPRIRRRQFTVLLDSNHGAGAVLGRRLLEELGCRTVILGEQPTGQFLHPPEPTAANLADVGRQVVSAGADIGFCQDPDADRLAVIDQQGRYIGEEYTLALCLDHVLQVRRGPVVVNCATSRMNEEIARRRGAPFHRSAVGEANVADRMIEVGAVFGGEGNGGPIDPQVGYVRDSFVGMALILDSMAARQLPVGRLADELPRFEIEKTSLTLANESLPAAFQALADRFPEAASDRSDGLRLDWPDAWLLVRGSNTEPIVRIIAEAPSRAAAAGLCEQARQAIAAL